MNTAKANILGRCIEKQTGVSLDVIRSASKKRDHCTARALFVGLWELLSEFDSSVAASYLNRGREEINHIRRQHKGWIEVDKAYGSLFEACREEYKSQLQDLNDLELAEVRSELEHRLEQVQKKLVRVAAEQLRREAIRNSNQ